jgi:hypothetical protein
LILSYNILLLSHLTSCIEIEELDELLKESTVLLQAIHTEPIPNDRRFGIVDYWELRSAKLGRLLTQRTTNQFGNY